MTERSFSSKTLLLSALILAIGLILAGFLLGNQAKMIGSNDFIRVKGLAEKSITADKVDWEITATSTGKTFAEALAQLRKEKSNLEQFLTKQGFTADNKKLKDENIQANYRTEKHGDNYLEVLVGYTGKQSIIISTSDLSLVQKTYSSALDYRASGANIEILNPQYLVSNLEDVKMSLIDAATQNAYTRAGEFIKHGKGNLGAMRSASQGAFYILDDSANSDYSDYGGTYSKSTIDKVARVVVTIEFKLQ